MVGKKIKSQKENNRIIIGLIIIWLILIAYLVFYFLSSIPLSLEKVKVSFAVTDKIGLDLNRTALTFGNVLPGETLKRFLVINNKYSFPIRATVYPSDNLKGILIFQPDYSIVKNQSVNVGLTLAIPTSYPLGNYTGELIISIQRKIG